MLKIAVVAISCFLFFTFILYKLSIRKYKSENSEKMWNVWGMKSFYWQGLVIASGLITTLVVYILKKLDVLTLC